MPTKILLNLIILQRKKFVKHYNTDFDNFDNFCRYAMKVRPLFRVPCFFAQRLNFSSMKPNLQKYYFIKKDVGEPLMNRKNFISIVIFLFISSLSILILSYIFGSLYLPPHAESASGETAVLKYTTVIIDAGHGGEDGGASSRSGLIEKDVNLDIARQLAEMLSMNGINVVMTRNEDKLLYDRNVDFQGRKKKLDHAARLNVIQSTEDAIFISIHMNSYTDPKYFGLQVWYSQNMTDSFELADMIQKKNKELLQPENTRKIKDAASSIFLLDKATCPAVLVECGFLSNIAEAARFESEEYRREVAFVLYRAIGEFLNSTEQISN